MKHGLAVGGERTSGWFCYGHCQAFTELDMDREQNVCGNCRQPTVTFLPVATAGPKQAAPEATRRRAVVEAAPRSRLKPEKVTVFFAMMRAAVEKCDEGGTHEIEQ